MPVTVTVIVPNHLLDSEPENTEEDMSGDLGVAALDEEVNQLLQEMQEEAPEAPDPPRPPHCLRYKPHGFAPDAFRVANMNL